MHTKVLMLLTFLTSLTLYSSAADAVDFQSYVVTVDTGNNTTLQLKDRPRLDQLMTALQAEYDLYWPAARFYRDDPLRHYGFERKRRELLLQFGAIKRLLGKDTVPDDFAQLIRTARLAAPVELVLDPDAIAGKDELNMQLDRGDYILRVGKRPKDLEITGFAGQSKVRHQYNLTVRDYTLDLAFTELADQSMVYLLSPTLTVTAAGRALWNKSPVQIRPGTVLYIPIDESALPAEFSGINQQIIEFLQHRVTD